MVDPATLLIPLATQGVLGTICAYLLWRNRELSNQAIGQLIDIHKQVVLMVERKNEGEKLLAISQAQLAETVERLYDLVTRQPR